MTLSLNRLEEPRPAIVESDDELVEKLRGGERDALTQLVKRYEAPVVQLVFRLIGNESDAEDVVQRIFVQTLQKVSGFRGRSSFKTWLYRIALNLALTLVRDDRRRRRLAPVSEPESLEIEVPDQLSRAQEHRRLRALLDQLPAKQRTVIELRIYEELPFREVAQILDCTEESARTNLYHALRRLRQLMTEGDPL